MNNVEDLEGEIWKEIVGFDYKYFVSNFGRVYSNYWNKLFKPSRDNFGYLRINLVKDGVARLQMVHKLVATYFIENPYKGNEVNHLDKNPNNNHISNLEWVSSRENSTHKYNSFIGTSIYTGVSWDKGKQKWRATIYNQGKQIFIGRFDDEKEASLAYQNKLKELNDKNKYMICSENQ